MKKTYKVAITEKAQKQLKKLDKQTFHKITSWIKTNLEGCENPRQTGKALSGDKSGEWRYRVGDYRILAEIYDDIILIEIFKIGHRRDVYK